MNINATLLGQAITFAVFVWFTMRFVWPPLMHALHEREKKIADGLAAADASKKELEQAKLKANESLTIAKAQASDILADAHKRGDHIVATATDEAKVEAARVLAASEAELQQQAYHAREKLRQEVVRLAVLGAEKLLEQTIDKKAHEALLDKLAQQI